jgi:hypothetical protein
VVPWPGCDQAGHLCVQALELTRRAGSLADQAAVLNAAGLLARVQDKYAESARQHEAALALARADGSHSNEAAALLGMAYTVMFTGDGATAGVLVEDSLTAARRSGDRLVLARTLLFLGWRTANAGLPAAVFEAARARSAGALPQEVSAALLSRSASEPAPG